MQRNRAAVVTHYIDEVQERIVNIACHFKRGTLPESLQDELDQTLHVWHGLKYLLDQHGGNKREPRFLTTNGQVRILQKILTELGNHVQQQRVIEGVAVERLVDADAAYKFLYKELTGLHSKQEAAKLKAQEFRLRGVVGEPSRSR